jgi:LPS-assembly lipoprotein
MTLRRMSLPFACICLLVLAACGFHPRGELMVPASLGPVKVVSSDPYSPLGDSLARVLTRAGVAPAAATDSKVATLRIVSETWVSSPLSVSAFAQIREYIITYTVKYSFTAADNTDVIPLQEQKLQRDFVYADSHALGSAVEQTTIREEMQRDMTAMIIRQLGVVLRHSKS